MKSWFFRFFLCTLIIGTIMGNGLNGIANDNIKNLKPVWAWLDGKSIISLKVNVPVPVNSLAKNMIVVTDTSGAKKKISKVNFIEHAALESDNLEITLASPQDDVTSPLFISINKSKKKIPVIARNVLNDNEYYYSGDDLGCSYKKTGTIFKLWSPTALGIKVKLYDFYNSNNDNAFKTVPMHRKKNGVWTAFVGGDLNEKYYLYEITQYYDGQIKTLLVQDPYSIGSAVNSSKSFIFNMNEVNKEVPGWDIDEYAGLKHNVDAVIYELHVRDFTISRTSGVPVHLLGRYRGLAVHNTQNADGYATGIDHLIDLGVTHVHLLPTFDYGSGDEAQNNITYTWYNWGYDPVLYNNVEGSYSSNPNGITRYVEYKKMIQALHTAGIGVIYDAVFAHTYETGDKGRFSIFDKIVPYYFYRTGYDGKYSGGSGCGNEVASERPMVRKFILDSVRYLTDTYHIDGFRFDQMGLLDKKTILDVYNEVKKINPNALIYGEAWSMPSVLDMKLRMTQYNVQHTDIAAFNDGIRNAVAGDIDKHARGYVQGVNTKKLIDRLKVQIKGEATGGHDIIPVASPEETVNYVSVHDNLCLWDKLRASMPKASDVELLKMDKLAIGIIMTSQGIPFFTEGDDFGRTKHGDENSYNNNDPTINPVNWTLKTKHHNLFEYYKGLISLRRTHPAFRMTTKKEVDDHLEFLKDSPHGVIAYVLKNNANGDSWKNILVAFNNSTKNVGINIVGDWNIVVDGNKAGTDTLNVVRNTLTVPTMSMLVAYTNSSIESFEY